MSPILRATLLAAVVAALVPAPLGRASAQAVLAMPPTPAPPGSASGHVDPDLVLKGVPQDHGVSPKGEEAAVVSEPALDDASDHAAVVPEAAVIAETIHRLGRAPQELRLTGEIDVRDVPVTLTSGEAKSNARVRITYGNAVSVMPEVSRMRVSVNGTQLIETPIESTDPGDPRTVEAAIPAGVLEPGVNSVRIDVSARHRVDCSVDATHELWVQVDAGLSGILFETPAPAAIADVSDIGAIRPNAQGAVPMRIVVPAGTDAQSMSRLVKAAEAVAIRGHFFHPDVSVVPAPVNRPGLDIVAGLESQLKTRGLGDYVPDDGTHVAMRTGGMPGHAVMVLTGLDFPELDGAIASLLPASNGFEGTPAGARAQQALDGYRVRGGSSLTLRDIGFASTEFSGRLFRRTFDILLPPDFYPADYARLTFALDAGYSAGLARGSQILVRVNDRDASSLPLGNPSGDVFKARPVVVPLGFLRPGLNHVSIEAELFDHNGRTCDMIEESKHQRFVLLDTSRITMPEIARIARMPALSATAASAFPYDGAAGVDLVIPHPDADAVGASATILSRMAVASGVLVSPTIKVGRSASAPGDAIFVGAYPDIPKAVLDTVGLDGDSMRDLWSAPKERSPPVGAQVARDVRVPANSPAPGADDATMFRRWSDDVSTNRWDFDPVYYVGLTINRMSGLTSGDLPRFGPEDRIGVKRDTEIVFGQHRSADGSGTLTAVVSPSGALLRSGSLHVAASRRWYLLDGRASLFDPKLDVMEVVPARSEYFISTQPFSAANARLIVAGWLSANVFIYGGIFLGAALLLGIATRGVVKRVGEKP